MRHLKFTIEKKIYRYTMIFLFAVGQFSCKKFVEVNAPYTSFNGENVYTTDATAIAAVTNIYSTMSNASVSSSGIPSLSFFCGLSADELALFPGSTSALNNGHYTNGLTTGAAAVPVFWNNFYSTIFIANSAIEGLSTSNSLTPAVKQQLLGECYFTRAFCYFYLVNLYGDVPLAINSDYKVNSLKSRTASDQVWKQIISDLYNAQSLLSGQYLDATLLNVSTERVRPIKSAATALLARAQIYIGNWAIADSAATAVIINPLYSLSPLTGTTRVFTKNCSEAIWQLQPVQTGWNTQDARVFALPSTGPNTSTYPVYLNNRLTSVFETNDQRKVNWVKSVLVGTTTYFYPAKYQSAALNNSVTEYNTVLRLAELYLIRAEARAQQNSNIAGAISDLNMIRTRAGLPGTTASDKQSLLSSILRERRVELFTEYGHRWLDLKRTQTVNSVMGIETPLKGGTWTNTAQLYPVSITELANNPNLTQTPGY